MTTLFAYVSSLPELMGKVHWDVVPTKSAGPYALLFEGVQAVSNALHQNQDVVSRSVSCQVFWPPPESGNLASIRPTFMALIREIECAVHHITLDSDGKTPLIALHRSSGLPPSFDKETGGLVAVVRFTAQLLRG